MGSVWFALRADLRLRWRAMLGLALLLGLIGGAVLTAAAGARRTETAYPRLLQWAHASQVTIVPGSRELGLTATGTGRTGFYAALGHVPQVEAVSITMLLGMAVVVRHGPPDMNATTEGSLNGALGVSVDRVQVLAGHLFDRADRKAVMIDEQMAALTHLRPGGILHVLAIPGFTTSKPDLKHEVPLAFRVSAIVRFDTGIVPADAGSAHPQALFSPAFIREVVLPRFPWLGTSDYAGVRLRPGASMTSFVRRVNVLLNRFPATGKVADIGSSADGVSLTERAMRPEAVALALFATLAGLIALAILSQLLSRQLILDSAEFPVLRALGMARWKLITASLARVGVVTAAGGVLGVGIAIAASPLMPLGLARLAEPSPGLEINLAILGAGLAAAAILPLLLVAPVAVRAATRAGGLGSAAEPAVPVRPSRLGSALSVAGSVTGGVGVRMAFESGRGRTAVPVRSALVATTVAVGAVIAATVFGASFIGLVSTPHRYGQNWAQEVDFVLPAAPQSLLSHVMSAQPGVRGYAAGIYGQASVNGQHVPTIGVDPLRGRGFLTLLSGRLPSGPDEIVLGQRTLRAVRGRIGGPVRVEVNGGKHSMRVVGEAIFASFTEGGLSATDLGEGAAMAPSVLSTPFEPTGCVHGMTCYSFILVRYSPGTQLRDADARLQATLAKAGCTLAAGCYSLTADQRPSDIRDYAGVRDTPLVLGALLALLAIGTLTHVLVTGVRRRRRDLALLKTLGLVRSQLLRVVFWEAIAFAAVALLAGLPLGVLAGRWAWAVFAASAGVSDDAAVPMLVVLAVIPVTLLLAIAIAAGPGWTAARVRPATVLRSE